MHDEANIRSVQGLTRYLRTSAGSSNRKSIPEYDDFLRDVDALFALRMRAEEYWGGSPRGSSHNYIEHRFRAKSADGALPLEWKDIYDELCPLAETPPRRLIVHIALNCTEEVRLIAAGMRRVLSRERVITPICRAQQIDTHCMRWLMMQPGRTTLEKAGTRQRIMAVVRREQFDTLENRVFKDFVLRCKRLAADYLQILPEKFKNGEYKEAVAVKSLEIACDRVMALPELSQITALPNLPQPNYVLQQDAKYSKIWKMYLKVVEWLRVAEKLWQNRNAIAEKVNKLREISAKRVVADNFLYQSRMWFNPFGRKEDPFDHGVTNLLFANNAQLERRAQQDVSHMIADGIGVIDLTGEDVYGDWLVVGGLHENALPRIQDDTYPLWDDMEQVVAETRRSDPNVAGLSKRKVSELCTTDSIYTKEKPKDANESLTFVDYARCLVGEYRTIAGKDLEELIILSPDDWDVYTQESAIQAFSSMGRSHVRLLWRSVAAVLGCEVLISPHVSEDSFLVVMDFRKDGSILLSSLKYLREGDKSRLIPQRAAFKNNAGKNGRHERIGTVDIRRAFQSRLIVDADVVCVTGCVPDAFGEQLSQYGIRYEVQSETLFDSDRVYKITYGKSSFAMVIENADDDWLLHGARRFCRDRQKCVLYYDELEPMWVVGQDKDKECITQYSLVQGDERCVGGQEYLLKIPDGIMGIGVGNNAVEFLFHIGSLEQDTKLHSYKEELSIERLPKDVFLTGNIRVSAGQGIAITTVDAVEVGILRHPVELDYSRGMTLSDETIETLEERLPRSYPPVSAKVEAYQPDYSSLYFDGYEMDKVRRYVIDYLRGKITVDKVPSDLFCHAQRIKVQDLGVGDSPLRTLDRMNVFGNTPEAMRPSWLSVDDEQSLLDKLVRDESRDSNTCRRLLAWTYRGSHAGVRRIVETIVNEYKNRAKQTAGIDAVSCSLLSNTLSSIECKSFELDTVKVFIERLWGGFTNANDYRLMYNILQFDGEFFKKFYLSEQLMIEIFQRLRVQLTQSRKDQSPQKYQRIMKCLLYFLRYREDNPDFLRDETTYAIRFKRKDGIVEEMSQEYARITAELACRYLGENGKTFNNKLREVTLDFVKGSGKLPDIVTLVASDSE